MGAQREQTGCCWKARRGSNHAIVLLLQLFRASGVYMRNAALIGVAGCSLEGLDNLDESEG